VRSFRKLGYLDRLHTQTSEWLKGNPQHNAVDGECCPDFSCCNPELLAPKEVRELFYKADQTGNDKVCSRMLGEFLGKMVDAILDEPKVHIAGLDESRQELE